MKLRLDELLIHLHLAPDIDKARAMIGAGEVYADDRVVDKAGMVVSSKAQIRLKDRGRYVSRGGLKLEKALEFYALDPTGLCCLDVGASSGGFTDCLLQHGARKVFAVDVAYGQLDWKIRQDQRVVAIERFNARKISPADLDERINLAVMDTSFISITRIIPAILPLFAAHPRIIALIKPQFELPKDQVGPGGVVRDPALHRQAIQSICDFAAISGLIAEETVQSPILGPKGNTEFLIHLHD